MDEPNMDLICISTCRQATPEIASDLMNAHKRGEEVDQRFKAERLESSHPRVKFHDRIPKLKLKTFSDMNKIVNTKANGKNIILQADRNLFGRKLLK